MENDICYCYKPLVARSIVWEIFSSFTALSFTSSEVDELEKSNCSVKLGIPSFVSMIEFNLNKNSGKKNAGGLLSRQCFTYSHLKCFSSQSH